MSYLFSISARILAFFLVVLLSSCARTESSAGAAKNGSPLLAGFSFPSSENRDTNVNCYTIDTETKFDEAMKCMKEAKPLIMKEQAAFLDLRYDLADHPSKTVFMFRGKPIQIGVRTKLPPGQTWEALSAMTPEQIREKQVFPSGFMPLPHVVHAEGGMVFPKVAINEILKQTGRNMDRVDMEFDLPQHILPEFPPPMFLTTHPELGDVTKGELVTTNNFYRLFKTILNEKQLNGLRLLVTPMPQQQFNLTNDRRSEAPHLGVSCLDCHVNGHTNSAFHLVGDIRPQEERNRIETPTLRGVNIQRLFGSQRALKSVEDFTQFEQSAAYFDGDISKAAKKGVVHLDPIGDVQHMAEFQELMDFPPAPKLDWAGRLIHAKATPSEIRGEALFNGKAQCATCHPAPYYTDNTMHNLQLERFFKPTLVKGHLANGDGPIKTFPLRGIKDSPPYFHDGRLLTLDDTVEFFNLVLELKLSAQEKSDLLDFMRVL